ncbi:hypothetical protein [Bacillus tequilensis]|uniref:Uncharacterized protein n=1 Tax=Bacillus tequilensis TaxID=227866 RepID=A0A6H0WJC3_9BACI|nr:hypothetical protein [Bacillus tequilensis]OTQ88013.1 hypothetical protein BG30_02150 [Bacillus subtilis subsp. subtilis]QIW80059.1 hypothetical protein G4P54_09690 [Bacillus tequilensis]
MKCIQIEMAFTDEYGQVTKLNKTYKPSIIEEHKGEIPGLLLDDFKRFLSSLGFNEKQVSRIIIEY